MNKLKMCIASVLLALTVIVTAFLCFPIPKLAGGYIHMGDAVVFLSAAYLGAKYAGIIGGIGGALADIIVAPMYAPFTLIIKALMGFSAGILLKRTKKLKIVALLPPCAIMICGYFITEALLFSPAAAIYSVPFNLIQAASSAVITSVMLVALKKIIPLDLLENKK